MQVSISNTEALLNNEISWLKKIKQSHLSLHGGATDLAIIDSKGLVFFIFF